jgi:hypothetical protein
MRYERLNTIDHHHEGYAGRGVISVNARFIVQTTWTNMTTHPPHTIILSCEDEGAADRWHNLLRDSSSVKRHNLLNRIGSFVISTERHGDHDNVWIMEVVRRELGISESARLVDHEELVASEMRFRLRCVRTIMHLKSLIPAMPIDQPQALYLRDTSSEDVSLSVHDDVLPLVLDFSASDVAAFAARVPLVRWDKLDDFLRTCGEPPTVTHEVPVLR